MSPELQLYIGTLAILFGVDVIAVWGLDLQYGVTGINNFAYIVFQAIGGYTAAILTLGHPDAATQGVQQYLWGAHWVYPLPVLGGALAAGIVGIPVAMVAMNRLRGDYQAMVMLVVSIIATDLASNQIGVLNGVDGLSQIPKPLTTFLNLSTIGYQWVYLGIVAAGCAVTLVVMRRITGSPLGRTLRAVRDSETAAEALGKNVKGLRVAIFVIGCTIAGMSGALLVEFLGAWSPQAWLYPETFLYFTAIIVGGSGSLRGAALGALIVPIGLFESTRFLPTVGYPGLIDSLSWVVIGVLMLFFLWFRPSGLLPERRRRFPKTGAGMLQVGGDDPLVLAGFERDRVANRAD